MGRPSTTYRKRMREFAKRDRRKAKAEKREMRKNQKHRARRSGSPVELLDPADVGLPQLDFLRAEKHRLPMDIRERIERRSTQAAP